MSLYSAIQFTSVSFLYAKASNLGDFQFLFIDLLLILPIAVFMGWAGPAPVLSRKRPTADLVSRKVLAPLIGLMTICVTIQAVAYVTVREQSWYIPPKVKHEESNIKNSENTALFLVSCFEYILSGVVLNAGLPFRQGITQNCKSPKRALLNTLLQIQWIELFGLTGCTTDPFCFTILSSLIVTIYMILSPAHRIKKIMQLTSMSLDYKLFLIGLGLVYFLLAWVYEKHMGMHLARILGRAKERITGKAKKRKMYKLIKESMMNEE